MLPFEGSFITTKATFVLFSHQIYEIIFPFQKIKNTAIIVQIPLLRETIAQLLYKVKGALAANKCSSAFWMGNLKNKDIYGEEILSQTTSITGSNITADDENGDEEDVEEEEEQSSGDSAPRRRTRQSNRTSASKGKKRKLYRKKNGPDDDNESTTDNNDDENTSRSRCF